MEERDDLDTEIAKLVDQATKYNIRLMIACTVEINLNLFAV